MIISQKTQTYYSSSRLGKIVIQFFNYANNKKAYDLEATLGKMGQKTTQKLYTFSFSAYVQQPGKRISEKHRCENLRAQNPHQQEGYVIGKWKLPFGVKSLLRRFKETVYAREIKVFGKTIGMLDTYMKLMTSR